MNTKNTALMLMAISSLCLSSLTLAGDQDTMGATRLTFTFVVPAKSVPLAEEVFACHAPWMEATHRSFKGSKALLSYDVTKELERKDPTDLKSKPTGKTVYVLNEVYASVDGVEEHLKITPSWKCFDQFVALVNAAKTTRVVRGQIFNSSTWGKVN